MPLYKGHDNNFVIGMSWVLYELIHVKYVPQSWSMVSDQWILVLTMYLQLCFSMTMIKYQYPWKTVLEINYLFAKRFFKNLLTLFNIL